MDILEAFGLAGLALLDSTSIGTLVVPLFLLLGRSLRVSRVLLYLATISIFYFAVGVLLLFGTGAFIDQFSAALSSPVAYWIQLMLGIALFAASWFVDPASKAKHHTEQGLPPEPSRWEQRLAGTSTNAAVIGVALLAGFAELATMLPYLGAIGILTASGLPMAGRIALLAGYVVVMIVPALAMLGIRLAAGERAHQRLARIRDWVARQASASLPWILGIIGFLIARDAIWRLGWWDRIFGG